jgi:hypothetical protein
MGFAGRAAVVAALGALMNWPPAWAEDDLAKADFGSHRVSADARLVAERVLELADHGGRPFAIIDKQDARIYVFDANGRLSGASAALLGQMRGDHASPEVGAHAEVGSVPVHERTTPAGRFVSEPGLNPEGEHLIWIDFSVALAIHRLRPGASQLHREARLASFTSEDNRVSLGCVVVPPGFYDQVVRPAIGSSKAIIYVLPEETSAREMFDWL